MQLLQSTFFIGILLGAILNGIAADRCAKLSLSLPSNYPKFYGTFLFRHGRKAIFVYVCPMLLLALFLGALSPSALIYGVSLFVKGICVAGIYSSAFVIGIEVTGGRYRFWLGNVHSIVFALGAIYSCLMADYFRAWRLVEIALTFPVILMLPYPCIFPESIRWQISNGKIESAVKQIRQAAALNRISIPEEVISSLLSSEQVRICRTAIIILKTTVAVDRPKIREDQTNQEEIKHSRLVSPQTYAIVGLGFNMHLVCQCPRVLWTIVSLFANWREHLLLHVYAFSSGYSWHSTDRRLRREIFSESYLDYRHASGWNFLYRRFNFAR